MRDVWEVDTGELKSKQLQPVKGNKSREMSCRLGGRCKLGDGTEFILKHSKNAEERTKMSMSSEDHFSYFLEMARREI